MEITCFMAAICRDKIEGGDGTRYFGSLGAFTGHMNDAAGAGLIDSNENLTERGIAVGKACLSIPEGRAYAYSDQYKLAASGALSGGDNV